jgi:hypothetical protein
VGDGGIIIEYLRSCTAGSLGMSDCGPVWQLGIIAAFLVAAIVTLVILRLRASRIER